MGQMKKRVLLLKIVKERYETGLGSLTKLVIVPSSSSMVLPFVASFNPRILLNRMEKALPHTPVQHIQSNTLFPIYKWMMLNTGVKGV